MVFSIPYSLSNHLFQSSTTQLREWKLRRDEYKGPITLPFKSNFSSRELYGKQDHFLV
jgi:hypothetical protein